MIITPPLPPSLEDRFGVLVESFGGALRRTARLYEARSTLRDELEQEMLLQLWRALPSLRSDTSLRPWTFRILHNTGLKHARTGTRRVRESGPLQRELAHAGALPEEAAIVSERRELLYTAMRTLPPIDAELVALQLEGLDAVEIAEVLGLSATNITTRLHRARNHLSRLLNEARRDG